MKATFYLFLVFLANLSFASPKQIVLECLSNCDPVLTISDFLKTEYVFSSPDVLLIVEQDNIELLQISYSDYIDDYWLPNNGFPDKSYLDVNTQVSSHDVVSLMLNRQPDNQIMDGSLDCRFDPDFS